jgi:hypothetical protein
LTNKSRAARLPRRGRPSTLVDVLAGRPKALGPSIAVTAAVLGGLACSADPDPYTADADSGSTHALISVERSTTVGALEAPRATALAGFVRVPPIVDAKSVLSLVGLGLDLPSAGQCARSARTPEATTSLAPLGRVEFLEAGDVTLSAGGSATVLAPRAFPTVTDLVSGVVYTTRDRSADPLPAGERYSLRTQGAIALAVDQRAPAALEGVTVGGLPLAEVSSLSIARPIDLTWNVGEAGDIVYAELTSGDGVTSTVCTFRDDAGSGTVPAGVHSGSGAGTLELHRTRTREFASAGINHGELRFDFELVTQISYSY